MQGFRRGVGGTRGTQWEAFVAGLEGALCRLEGALGCGGGGGGLLEGCGARGEQRIDRQPEASEAVQRLAVGLRLPV